MKKIIKILGIVTTIAAVCAGAFYLLKKFGYIPSCDGNCDDCPEYDVCFGEDANEDEDFEARDYTSIQSEDEESPSEETSDSSEK